MNQNEILSQANSAPNKLSLEAHRDTILVLRDKGYTWREIAKFLDERGVSADHTSVYRLVSKPKKKPNNMNTTNQFPSSEVYQKALTTISISEPQRAMLNAHYDSLNRSITYTKLAEAAGYADYGAANLQYGQLGFNLGEAIGFDFIDSDTRPGEKFYSSSIGMPNSYTSGHFQLVMHHELAKAIQSLGWFNQSMCVS